LTDSRDVIPGTIPEYGKGVFRRRICLQSEGLRVIAEVEDVSHGFRVHMQHDETHVTDIGAEMLRHPFNTCPGAIDQLQLFAGWALASERSTIRRDIDPSVNCTHLYDLAVLALAHATRPQRQRIYDIEVPDIIDGQTAVTVHRDGMLVHSWQIKENVIVAPESLSGVPIMKGFYRKASDQFVGDELEAATVLQMGFYVSRARMLDPQTAAGMLAAADGMPHAACHTYGVGVVEQAWRIGGTERDFTDAPEMLLKFR